MKNTINYKPDYNNKESFICQKFCTMPDKVVGKDNIKYSYNFLFMNNEFIKLLKSNLISKEMSDIVNLEMLLNIKKLIAEEISFYENYDKRCQELSKIYKNQNIKLGNLKNYKEKNDLILAKYLCFKEAYDLELEKNKIKNFDIENAKTIMYTLNKITGKNFDYTVSKNIREKIIEELDNDIKSNTISTVLESDPYQFIHNKNYFKAIMCSEDILKRIKKLYENDKLSINSINFCIQLLSYSIDASNGTIGIEFKYLCEKDDINSYNKEDAMELKRKLICRKYKKAYNS